MNNPSKPNIAGRKKARRIAMQALYSWEMTQNPISDIEEFTLSQHTEEVFDKDYFLTLLHAIPKQVDALDEFMQPFLSRKLEELGPIEITLLRIAGYELKERLEIPYRVIINEALVLCKTFGANESYKFVNGVLDKMAREVRKTEF